MGATGWGMGRVEFCAEAVVVGSVKYDLAALLRHSGRSGVSLGGRGAKKGWGEKQKERASRVIFTL